MKDPLPCPLCGGALDPAKGRHGVVWLCRVCRAGAATMPILRQVAPRPYVNHLWQVALHHGRESRLVCPSCEQPFTALAGPVGARQLAVCVRCHWVWLSLDALTTLVMEPASPPALLGSMTARVLRDVL